MQNGLLDIPSITKKHWDAIIIGTGFGGSMTALRLANAGMDVLMLERGDWVVRDDSVWDVRSILIDRNYKAPSPYDADAWVGRSEVYPDMAVGGNSIFYGAASLRLREFDFEARSHYGKIADDLELVDWPIAYSDLAPYYDQVEHLLGVAGVAGQDPFEPPRNIDFCQEPAPYSTPARLLAETGRKMGLSPFPLPLAINYGQDPKRENCIHCTTCDLFPCKISAKNDLSVTVLPEALAQGAKLRPNTVAAKLLKKESRITGVECVDRKSGERFALKSDVCIVSGGGVASARLLQLSGLQNSPRNGDLIGRYLLRHCNGVVIGMFPFQTNPEQKFNKQVAFTDFYINRPENNGLKGPMGMLQALQVPPPEYITSQAPAVIGQIGAATTKLHMYLLCIAEDLPNPQNRVRLHDEKRDGFGLPIAKITSKYHKRDLRARRALYREGAKILKQAGAFIRVKKPINTYSHAVGTCRFGNSPDEAVLDPNCNFFGVPNLFVIDGSFMPTSGSVNPSLTIAANALRVADYLANNWELHAARSKNADFATQKTHAVLTS